MLSCGDSGQRIELVVYPTHRPLHARNRLARLQHRKITGLTHSTEVAHRRAKTAHRAPAARVQHTRQAFLKAVDHNAAAARHRAHKVVKLAFNSSEIVKNVGVVELQVVEHRSARPGSHTR